MITFLALVAVVQAFMALCLATMSYSASNEALASVERGLRRDLAWANLTDTVQVARNDVDMLRSRRNHPASGNF